MYIRPQLGTMVEGARRGACAAHRFDSAHRRGSNHYAGSAS